MWLSRDNAAPVAGARFIEPQVLARINNLELIAKTVVDGFISGLHRAPYLGLSIDFAEHRPYMPGDDIRRIDWRVYGRTDRLYVKNFQAETNANLSVLLDVSRSMAYGEKITKLDYARMLAASVAYMSIQQRDRVGLVTFDDDIVVREPPSTKRFDRVLHALDASEPRRAGSFEAPMKKIAQSLSRRGIVALISDLYVEPDEVLDGLAELRHRGHDVLVFHVLDPGELELPATDARQFEDMESGARMPVVPEQARARYAEAVRGHIDTLQRRLGEHRVDYGVFDTTQPLDHALFRYLTERQRRIHVR
jgi:uncharacterized protein (DUF58 family)